MRCFTLATALAVCVTGDLFAADARHKTPSTLEASQVIEVKRGKNVRPSRP